MLSVILCPYFIYCLLFQRLSLYSFKKPHFCLLSAKLFSFYFCTTFPSWTLGDTRNRIIIILLPIREVIKSAFTFFSRYCSICYFLGSRHTAPATAPEYFKTIRHLRATLIPPVSR